MYFTLSNAIKKKFVLIFQDILRQHPIFKKAEVFTKFPDKERPKFALLIRSVSGSSQKLGLDNFGGTRQGYSSLANLKEISGNSIEWIRDDRKNIKDIAAPGYYIVRMIEEKSFVVDPYLLVDDEIIELRLLGQSEGAIIKNPPINPNSEKIFSTDGLDLKPNIDYTINYSTGEIYFTQSVREFDLRIDYQSIGEQLGPFSIDYYTSNNIAIPGVTLAFGDRLKKGDEQVVIVEKQIRDIARIFTGRWNLSLDITGIAQDPDQQERLVDYAISIFWAEWQHRLTEEGIHVSDFSLSGESEDMELEIPEEYYYTGGISFTAETDWEMEIPLISEIRRMNVAVGLDSLKRTLTDEKEDRFVSSQFDDRMVNSGHQLGMQATRLEPIITRPSLQNVKTRKY